MKDLDGCGCCEGITAVTPELIESRPGLDAIKYRVGTHATFLETMEARLGQITVTADPSAPGARPLLALRTREKGDPAIAMLDAFATVGDVLTFYQERIANEGYLRTATERRSLVELGRLVGYSPRAGVAASAFLAFTMQEGGAYDGVVPAGTRAQTLPRPGQTPQTFETSEPVEARAAFNLMKPALVKQQSFDDKTRPPLFLKGQNLNLAVNDPILVEQLEADEENRFAIYRISALTTDAPLNRTRIEVKAWHEPDEKKAQDESTNESAGESRGESTDGPRNDPGREPKAPPDAIDRSLDRLMAPPPPGASPPADPLAVAPSLEESFKEGSDALLRTILGLRPDLKPSLYAALRGASDPIKPKIRVYALRVKAGLFGGAAPKQVDYEVHEVTIGGGDAGPTINVLKPVDPQLWVTPDLVRQGVRGNFPVYRDLTDIYLDGTYDKIKPSSYLVLEAKDAKDKRPRVLTVKDVIFETRTDYGASQKTTELTLGLKNDESFPPTWYDELFGLGSVYLEGQRPAREGEDDDDAPARPAPSGKIDMLSGVTVYAQSEELDLDEIPNTTPLGQNQEAADPSLLDLDGFYEGLAAGRWLIVSGERADLPGVKAGERALIGGVEQVTIEQTSAKRQKTLVHLASPLANSYIRSSVVVYGNIAHATHGETKSEVLGSGDASKPYQSFSLLQKPLTYISAETPSGAASTLAVRVDGILWKEVKDFYELGPKDRGYITRADEKGKVTITFGDGRRGARPSTGVENLRAEYRVGIGAAGNADPDQITSLSPKPLGVQKVTNPLQASGGADPESPDQIRKNVPVALMAFDRLVSLQDHADFAQTFAGVDKAYAVKAVLNGAEVVHVTIAAVDDAPVDPTSDLYQNLSAAFHRFGDPQLSVRLSVREAILLLLGAGVRVAKDVLFRDVEPRIRARLLDRFGFARRALWQDITKSEVIAEILEVPGVVDVKIEAFGGIPERIPDPKNPGQFRLSPSTIASYIDGILHPKDDEGKPDQKKPVDRVLTGPRDPARPAPLVYLSSTIRETLNLRELPT